MTYPSIPEMNRVIGELDGYIFSKSGHTCTKGKNGPAYKAEDLKYHKSWKLLKEVIDKIFMYAIAYPDQVKPFLEMRIVVGIKFAHQAVYEFALWYKENVKEKVS